MMPCGYYPHYPHRAERRLGEMMAAQKETVGLNKGGGDQRSDHRVSKKPSDKPTLADADKNFAKRPAKGGGIGDGTGVPLHLLRDPPSQGHASRIAASEIAPNCRGMCSGCRASHATTTRIAVPTVALSGGQKVHSEE
jgi:hypothetical protein